MGRRLGPGEAVAPVIQNDRFGPEADGRVSNLDQVKRTLPSNGDPTATFLASEHSYG